MHRLSGLALAVFLPLHFLTLGLAIDGEARLEGFLRWSDAPLVKLAEGVLVFLLAVHLLGGLRLLAMENLAWHDGQKRLAVIAARGRGARRARLPRHGAVMQWHRGSIAWGRLPPPSSGGGLGWGSADSPQAPRLRPATPSPTLRLSGRGRRVVLR